MLSARALIVLVVVSLAGTALWAISTAAERKAELEQSEAAIRHLSNTLKEQRQRYDETDKLLAQTARQRDRLQREASRLATDLAALDECPGTAIGAAVVERVLEYRAGHRNGAGASAQGLD